MRSFLIAAVVLGLGQAAQAADLPFLRGSFQDGPVVQRPIWEGFYIGGQATYGSTDTSIPATINADIQPIYSPPPGPAPLPTGQYRWPGLASPQANNAGYGGFLGYNSQWDDVIVGIEANYIHGKYNTATSNQGYSYNTNSPRELLTTNSTAAIRIDDFGSMRLRGGYALGNFLGYAFVGGGVGTIVVDRSTLTYPGPGTTNASLITRSSSNLAYGYSAGVGVDVMLTAGLFLRAEYEYQSITSKDIEISVNSARAGVGYRF